jgi:hypothetical protein
VPQRSEETSGKAKTETDKQLSSALGQISKYKKDITAMKKQLDGNLNEARITDLENQSKYLSKRIEELEAENDALQKIERDQKKALDEVHDVQNYSGRMKALSSETRTMKEKYRELIAQQKQDEKVLREQHERCVMLEEKCRKFQTAIKTRKPEVEVDEDEPRPPEVTENDVEELKEKIQEAEKLKVEEERRLKTRIKELESQIRDSKHNVDILTVQLKEKDQEVRLTVLKIKELKRVTRHNQLKPIYRSQGRSIPPDSKDRSRGESETSQLLESPMLPKHEVKGLEEVKRPEPLSKPKEKFEDEQQPDELGELVEEFEEPLAEETKQGEESSASVFSKPKLNFR